MSIQNVSRLSPFEPRSREVDPLSLKVLQHISRYVRALHSYPERCSWRSTIRGSPPKDRIHDEPHVACNSVSIAFKVSLISYVKCGRILTTRMDERHQGRDNFRIPLDKWKEWSHESLS
jgi:hypothetical protein